jgi:uncharacterized membrane protein
MTKRKWSNEEVYEYRNAKGSIFYYNVEDSNFIISRKLGIGWSFNWASPFSWITTLTIVAFVIMASIFS